MYTSSWCGSWWAFKYLLDNGADLHSGADLHEVITSLHFAVLGEHYEICRLIVEVSEDMAVNLHSRDEFGNTLLHSAAYGSYEICKLIVQVHEGMNININTKDDDGNTATHIAVEEDNMEIARLLFKEGGDLNSRTNEGDTPLHAASRYGRPEIAEFILVNGADKNPLNDNGDTPLYEATKKGYLEIQKFILTEAHHLKINYYVQENFSWNILLPKPLLYFWFLNRFLFFGWFASHFNVH